MTPYAPPRSDVATNATLDVDTKHAIPPVCLKCAATADVSPRPETLHVVTRRVRWIALGIGVAAGLAMMFIESVAVRAAVIVFVFVAARIVRMGVRPAFPKVELGLPLCASCNERWTAGMKKRRLFRVLTFVSVVAMLSCLAVGAPFVGMLFLFPGIAFTIANAMVRIRSKVIVATDLKGDVVTLSLVHPDAVAAIRAQNV